jgi:hypothetical protein
MTGDRQGAPLPVATLANIEAGFRLISFLLLAGSALAIGFDPHHAPLLLTISLVMAVRPWYQAWRSARGTALRPPLIWVALALGLAVIAQLVANGEPITEGRPIAGAFTYFSVLTMLAALLSVLNARNPGGRAWAGLMVLLLVVFLIPWLETPGPLRRGQGLAPPHLDAPLTGLARPRSGWVWGSSWNTWGSRAEIGRRSVGRYSGQPFRGRSRSACGRLA